MTARFFKPGNYWYLPGPAQFSGGALACAGYRIVRVRFTKPLPLSSGFKMVASIVTQLNRPLTSLCACELRSPTPLDDSDFQIFNRSYNTILSEWGLLDEGASPVARSNVCPLIDPPTEPSLVAFSYTEPAPDSSPSYVLSGCAEARPGTAPYAERIIRCGDASADGMMAKARFVHETIKTRAKALGVSLANLTGAHVYSMHDIRPMMLPETLPRAALVAGVTWLLCRPPVIGLEYEFDCRSVHFERTVDGD